MCTITIAKNVFDGTPLAIAANRDELLDRPSSPPALENGVLAPRDLQRGGRWIGVNQFGLFVGLTNRLNVKSKRGCASRGQLVESLLLQHKTAAEAFKVALKFDGSQYNGFHLVIADKDFAVLVCGNNKTLDHVEPIYNGFFVVSNHGVGNATVFETPRRVSAVLTAWDHYELAKKDPTPENLKKILDLHDEWRQGTCINDTDDNYGSKSSSIIRLDSDSSGDKWRYWHRERKGSTHICQIPFDSEIQLPITDK